jgi:hypothetical protein
MEDDCFKARHFTSPRANIEQGGGKFKFWCHDDQDNLLLFKQGRQNTGENWAEVIACEIANMIGLPSAQYEFATWHDPDTSIQREGVLTKKVLADNENLILGNELLSMLDSSYTARDHRRVKKHTVGAALGVMNLNSLQIPRISTEHGMRKAKDVLAGYFIFDSLISNTDRHHENWGMIAVKKDEYYLCPTFDHASSLGRELTQERKESKLLTKDKNQTVEAYTSKAKSAFSASITETRLMKCREVAASSIVRAPKSIYWVKKIANLTDNDFYSLIERVPNSLMSEIDKKFCLQMLISNKNNLETLL